jgi:hypothetical protein
MARGKQRSPTFVHINIRVSRAVHDYFADKHNMSEAIRQVLDDYVRQQKPVYNPDQLELTLPQ